MATSLLERQMTFGASSLSQLTRGNKIPNIGANASVPTTLPISLTQIAGAVSGSTLAVSIAPGGVSGSRTTAGVATTSGSLTATPSGGSGSYTSYTWHVTTNAGNTISAVTGTSASSQFSATVNGANDVANGSAFCTVTDSLGASANSPSSNVTLSYTGP